MQALHAGVQVLTIGGWVKLLVIGGTRFAGRAFVELAVRHGHDVTVFHRSLSEPEDFPSVEHLHGDRDRQLGLLRGRSWDAVLDTCAYVPRAMREASRRTAGCRRALHPGLHFVGAPG